MSTHYNDFRVQMSASTHGKASSARGKGAVASVSRQASELAIEVLRDGGNAFDAAFSLAFSLCIYHPQAGNIGGGGYLLFKEKGAAKPTVFNYREQSPAGATRESFLLPDGAPNPDRTAFGPTSVCVPGTTKAFFELHKRYGKLRAKDLLQAISKRAAQGAYVTQYEADCLNRLAPKLAHSPESKSIYCKDGPFKSGDILKNPHLSNTLEILANEGEQAFYQGRIGELIVADIQNNGGFLALEDLASYQIREVAPIQAEFKGQTVWTPPPEAGGALLIDILNILNREDFHRLSPNGPEFHHNLAQAAKIAFINRLEYLGDVSLKDNCVYSALFDSTHAERLFRLIGDSDTKTEILAELVKKNRELYGVARKSKNQLDNGAESHVGGNETTHFSVIDSEGNAVSNSYTMNLRYGSKWSVANAGFLLNGSMDSFSFQEGIENYFGMVGSKPNLFAPRKRPASNMAPVIVTTGKDVGLAIGTPGGPTIPTALAAIIASLAHGTSLEDAIGAERLHHQAWPDKLQREVGMTKAELLAALEARGYALKDKGELIGDVHAVASGGGPNERLGVSDYRREGLACAV